ncbi:MAG TPA: bifunctional metallophosphatase/5'-nucleotidase [Candidatus Bacteroides avicola]|uniref:Bifunctional metallophosphatase/5'-nucleotidase n=1 Tax=Candidatus Bacteroides avicola TaxID=2838468 RepID=A0A9D2HY42_9BACE|nr:bifunctional metallophosphatase/5'-nucleotidase [Candidatus Bacteroides avicola]
MKKKLLSFGLVLALMCPVAAQQSVGLNILQTSDTHSRIEPISPHAADQSAGKGGVLRRVAFVEHYRAEHPGVLLFDCGDISQGTPYYNMFKGELEVKMMNLMKYDAMTIGNHEFDFGLENMARLFRLASFQVVCANYDVSGTVLEGLVKPYVVLQREGLRIGVFGLSPRLEGLVQASNCQGVVYRDPIAAARETVEILRGREHCDVVICLSHLGMLGVASEVPGDEALATGTSGIDVILGGHSHTFMEHPAVLLNAEGREVPVMHTGKNGVYVGELKLILQKE